ncbi:MAG: PilN domain-containing protein [Gammaproteobacteria bacterium]|nr:PilN domain-containing protein [Gammaproteobacteria bacterium]NIR97136.1 PilN domain-containing protein [Gammaproteobacteria bacterium]NIT62834.1 PilN domain-containing protein [Gammaproteobacteria bacterium]NIV19798.1 pilus assembly protein PilN [Gammaproteobacteria bacterium]NIX11331.1 pilus assembly protein PilN [Gammaproteobacteria bacterium]
MARINLLPWREEQRRQRQQQFFAMLGLAAIAVGAAMGGVHMFVENRIGHQNDRNRFLEREIAKLDQQIKEINELERTKKRLLARMQIIQTLQASRPEIVHLFDELVRTLPEGVYLTSVAQKGSKVTLKGMAQSNARVSTYMWNVEKSEWVANPNLRVIETTEGKSGRVSKFELTAGQAHEEGTEKEGSR